MDEDVTGAQEDGVASEEEGVASEEDEHQDEDGAMEGLLQEAMKQLQETEEFTFKDIRPGTTVLVGYEEDFYAGEVEDVLEDSLASVNFMERCSVKQDAYKWPTRPDRATVHAKFILASNLPMTSSNGRIWTLDNVLYYSRLDLAFHRVYFV